MDAKLICQTVGVALRTPKNQLNLKKITHTIPNRPNHVTWQTIKSSVPPHGLMEASGPPRRHHRTRYGPKHEEGPMGSCLNLRQRSRVRTTQNDGGVVLDQFGHIYMEYYHSH
jgi:hypothetical protein